MDSAVVNAYTALLTEIDAIDPANPPAILRPGALAMTVSPLTAVNQLPQQTAHLITVTLTKGGLPLPDIQVQVASNFGTFDHTTATTNANGQATFTLSSSVAGIANITVTAAVTIPQALEYVVQQNPATQPFGIPSNTTQTLTATASKEWRSDCYPDPNPNAHQHPDSDKYTDGDTTSAGPVCSRQPGVAGRGGCSHRDGVQQTVEQTNGGVNAVRVELYDGSAAFLGFQITGPNGTGQPGYYLFTNLLAGRYQVRFCLPDGYSPTLQNQGSDDTLDSDGNASSGSSGVCAFYQTEVFDLPNSLTVNNVDLRRDFGLWRRDRLWRQSRRPGPISDTR